jgi:uncharacterized Zn ribbon protein
MIIEYCPVCKSECEFDKTLKLFYCSHCDAYWTNNQIIRNDVQPIRKKSEIKNEWIEKYGDKDSI